VSPAATIELDPYVVETLMPDLVGHDRRPSAFLVYLFLWGRAGGGRQRGIPVSLREIAEGTGLSKRAVQAAVRTLVRRRLVAVQHGGPTAVPAYTVQRPWKRLG
jgi:predicted DNA-binding transcriptional regulator